MKLRLVSLLLAIAAALVVSWMVREEAREGDTGAAGAPEALHPPPVAPERGPSEASPGERAADAGASPRREAAGASRRTSGAGTLVVQADEVDKCIDVRGSVLVLDNLSTGRTHRAVILENGGAAFEEVEFAPGRTAFALRTEVADRTCFPAAFTIEAADLAGDPPAAGVSVALVHRHRLEGVVRDAETRRPISEARVEVDGYEPRGASTGEDGRFALELPEPRGTVVVTSAGHQELLWRFPEETEVGVWLPDRRDFELLPDRSSAWIALSAARDDGRPAAGAQVDVTAIAVRPPSPDALRGLPGDERRRFLDHLRAEIEAFGPAATFREDLVEPLDAEGRTLLRLRQPGVFSILVRDGDHAGRAEVEVEAGQRVPVTVTLAEAATLALRATAAGEPAPAARLTVETARLPPEVVTTDERGRAVLRFLVPGDEGRVVAAPSDVYDLPAGAVPFTLPLGGGTTRLDVPLSRVAWSPVRGEVVDAATGQPIGRARVFADSSDRETITDASGRFVLEARPSAVVTAAARDHRRASVTRSADAPELPPIRLERLPRGADGNTKLHVRVVDGARAPLPAVTVLLEHRVHSALGGETVSEGSASARSGEDGRVLPFGFALAPGESVTVRLRGVTEGKDGVASFTLPAGTEQHVELRLLRRASLSGSVWLDGAPLTTAGVEVVWDKGALGDHRVLTAEDGTFHFETVPAGPGTLSAHLPFRAANLPLDLPERGTSDVVLPLEPSP